MIGKYAKAGMPFDEDGRIALAAAKRWIAQNIQKPNEATEGSSEARRRKKSALANLRELELAIKRGAFVKVADVESCICQMATIVRNNFLGLPSKCAPMLVGLSAPRIFEILTEEVREILIDLSKTEVVGVTPREARQEITGELEKDMIERARGLLANIPDKIAPALAASNSPAECETIIIAAFIEALDGRETSWRLQ